MCLKPSASNSDTKQELNCQKDSATQVTCDGSAAFSATISKENSKDNGSEAGGQRKLEYQPSRFAQLGTPYSQNFEYRQKYNQPNRKMY
jgi:hypothetical protein